MFDPSALFNSIFPIEDPSRWARRYSSYISLATPLFVERGADGRVRLIDIQGGVDPDWCEPQVLGMDRASSLSPPHFNCDAVKIAWEMAVEHLKKDDPANAMSTLLAGVALVDENWEQLMWELQRDRYSANAWFERDVRQVDLTDGLTGLDVVHLANEELDDAIESGYLRAPRIPRPGDSDWLNPLIAYAESQQLIAGPDEVQDAVRARMTTANATLQREGARA